jgi:Pyruvate/2-oxoacid:ferredoxin oxidoreductase delta subunit
VKQYGINKKKKKKLKANQTLQWIGHKIQGHEEKCVGCMHFQIMSL